MKNSLPDFSSCRPPVGEEMPLDSNSSELPFTQKTLSVISRLEVQKQRLEEKSHAKSDPAEKINFSHKFLLEINFN